MKQTLKTVYTIISIALLTSCGVATHLPIVTAKVTPTPTQMATASPTPDISPATLTPTPTSLPVSSPPDGLRMAYIIDRDLYFQDGSKPPLQLTHRGKDSTPVFSDDGERLVFYRGSVNNLYSVNLDGTQEKALVTGDLFASLGLGYNKFTEIASFAFVPGTHQILFNTRELSPGDIDFPDPDRFGSKWNADLLSLNTDTGEIEQLLPKGKGGIFYVSPDASMVGIQAKGHIDVVGIDGRMIRSHLVTYTPTQPYILRPNVSWNSDSTELIISLPAREIFDLSGPEAFTIWRYAIDGSTKTQLAFDPPPLDSCCASPDGNWFLYPYYYYPGKTSDTIPSGLYLGNLQNDSVQFYHPIYIDHYWSSDSLHFTYGDGILYLGSIDEQLKAVEFIAGGRFLGWLDNNRFLYYNFRNDMLGVGDIGNSNILISTDIPKGLPLLGSISFTFVYLDEDVANK